MARGRGAAGGRRYSHDAPLEGRRVWDVGDWGNASGYIGKQWEVVGLDRLRRRAKACTLPVEGKALAPTIVPLISDDGLQRRLVGLGLTNPDALLLYPDAEHPRSLIVRAVDFKWSLETANGRQISTAALEALFERIPTDLSDRIRRAIPGVGGPKLVARLGFFFSPQTRANELVRRSRWPGPSTSDVVFEPVDGSYFFSALPGWSAARQLAELDRATASLATVDGAEHYYRLGVGISAARTLLERSIFDLAGEGSGQPVPLDPTPLPLAEWALPNTPAIVSSLSPRVEARKVLTRRLREILRLPYSLRDLLRDLAAWTPTRAEPAERLVIPIPSEVRARWEPTHRRLSERYRAALLKEGRELAGRLGSEAAALDHLQRRRARYQQRARRWATELAARDFDSAALARAHS